MALNNRRSYATGYFEIEIDGVRAGLLQKIGGGNFEAELVKLPMSDNYYGRRHVANPKFDEISVTCGIAMGEAFKEWVKSSLDRNHQYKNGSINAANYDRVVTQTREFRQALITEVGFPAADATHKEVAYLNVKFMPERLTYKRGDGTTAMMPASSNQSQFRCENFRLSIDGLEDATKYVSKVEALTVKQSTTRDFIGPTRDYELVPGNIEYSNLKITLPERHIDAFGKWFEDFVMSGINTATDERHGMLEFLTPDLRKTLLSIELWGLGIFKLTRSELVNNDEKVANCTIEMYCEKFTIKDWED
jgi:hypothetical protein